MRSDPRPVQRLVSRFSALGARARVTDSAPTGAARFGPRPRFSIDIRTDAGGEYFELRCPPGAEARVLDCRPGDRHLLLTIRRPAVAGAAEGAPASAGAAAAPDPTFLCGHDEKHWFVAAIPEQAAARDVQQAKDALKPPAVWEAMREHGVPPEHRDRRRTAAFIRQGEWFFIPRPTLKVNKALVLRDEPIRRGAGKPHRCQFLYRPARSGEWVWVCPAYPNGLTQAEYQRLPREERRRRDWRQTVRDARVYVKGNIRHPDHKTVRLTLWHEVVMNTETEAEAMEEVAFLD